MGAPRVLDLPARRVGRVRTALLDPVPVDLAELRRQSSTFADTVSSREIEVLQLIADGLGNREISDALCVSEETVKTHVQRLLRKLNATGRAHAVAIGMRHRLIV